MNKHYPVLVVGGGTGGIAVAARLLKQEGAPLVGIVEPADKHYYQPLWTLVGGGVFAREESQRDEAELIPTGATWIRDAVESFKPEDNQVTLRGGETLSYDYLVIALGIQVNWDKIAGLRESLGKPGTGVCSNYSYDSVASTWENIRALRSGTAVFTEPITGVKCGGAPQKIAYLAEDHFRRSGLRDRIEVIFASGKDAIFAVKKYADALLRVCDARRITRKFQHNLVALDAGKREAHFERVGSSEQVTIRYDMIHVTPPMSAPDVVRACGLGNADGWVDVDKATLRHVRFANVFSLGDCSSLPTSKTGAAIRKQVPVLIENLLAAMRGQPAAAQYDGYTSCPLVTGYGKLILAEFDYSKTPRETFPFDQGQERYSMYALKAYGLPRMYWHGMMKGNL